MNFVDPPKTCQNQTTFVAHLVPQQEANVPDVRFVPALVLVATGIGVMAIRRRRRKGSPQA